MNTEDYYLIGKDNEGKRVWLEKPSWDCGWSSTMLGRLVMNATLSLPIRTV